MGVGAFQRTKSLFLTFWLGFSKEEIVVEKRRRGED